MTGIKKGLISKLISPFKVCGNKPECGGGGGIRTPVRKTYILGTTCLVMSFN